MLQHRFTGFACGKPCNDPADVVDWRQWHTHHYQHSLTSQGRGSAILDGTAAHSLVIIGWSQGLHTLLGTARKS